MQWVYARGVCKWVYASVCIQGGVYARGLMRLMWGIFAHTKASVADFSHTHKATLLFAHTKPPRFSPTFNCVKS